MNTANPSKECALLPVIRTHLRDLLPLLKIETNNTYDLDSDYTKCLYTAVSVMMLYLGPKTALENVNKCDTEHLKTYYNQMLNSARTRNPNSTFDPSPLLANNCIESLKTPEASSRHLYYIMISHANVTPLS